MADSRKEILQNACIPKAQGNRIRTPTGEAMTLHGAVWVWGGTVMIALLGLALLFLIHGQAKTALGLFFGANMVGLLVWLLATSFRRAYPPDEPEEQSRPALRDRLNDDE